MVKNLAEFAAPTPENYPGERHSNSYLLAGDQVIDVSTDPKEALEQFDEMLGERGQPLIKDRIPVLAYGRNASPTGAATKTETYSHGEHSAEDLITIPMMPATLADHDVVWHGRPAQGGGMFGELYSGDDVKGTGVGVWIQFLTEEQLAILHTTEGETYEVSRVPGVSLGEGTTIDAVGYTAREASVLLRDGKPIALSGIRRYNSPLEQIGNVATVPEALSHILGHEAVSAVAGVETPQDYIEKASGLPNLKARKELQASVYEAMQESGITTSHAHPGDDLRFGRAEFYSLPRGVDQSHHGSEDVPILEQHVKKIRPRLLALTRKGIELKTKYPDEGLDLRIERARILLDPARKIRTRAHNELRDHNRERRLEDAWKAGTIKRYNQTYQEFLAAQNTNAKNNTHDV